MDNFRTAFLDELVKTGAALRSQLTPQSSNVRGFSYDPKSQDLIITYKGGGTYRYKGVPPAVARSMSRSKSVGKAVNRRVKAGGFKYEKIANDPVKETVNIHGIPIALEWRKGEMRKYFNHDPLKARSVGKIDYNQKMHADYGYVKGVIDADGEELDVYLGPNRESERVFVLEKLRRTDSSFDENKIMLGYDSLKEARASYLQHQGKDELGSVYELTFAQFRQKFLRKNKFKKHANGDMLEYFQKNPQKHKEYIARRVVILKKKRAAGKYINESGRKLLKKYAGIADEIETQLERHERPINIGLGAALGGGLGIPVGGMVGGVMRGVQEGERARQGLTHPNPKAGALRRMLWARKNMPQGNRIIRGIRQSLNRGALIGGAGGLAVGGLMGLQIARALKGSREAKALNEKTMEALQGQVKTAALITVDSARARFVRSRQSSKDSQTVKYYAKKRRDARMAKQADEELMLQLEPHEPLPTETPISERVFQNLTAQAKTLPEEAAASQAELVMDKMAQQRRQIGKLAGACVKTQTWHGLTMKFEYLDGGERSGVNKEGEKWSRTMKGSYGYMPGTYGKGADGEAIDIYFSPRASSEDPGSVYKIRQLRKDDGKFDEDKFMVGYASSEDAKKAFLSNMPKWAFGDITEMSMNSFKTLVGQDQKKRKAA